jgi:hypothetical protein
MSRIYDIKAALMERADALLMDLLGKPTRRTSHEVRYRRHGSLAYYPGEGRFFDYEAGRGGDLIDLIATCNSTGIAEALRLAEVWLPSHTLITPYRPQRALSQQPRIEPVKAICAAARGASGSAVERYLRGRALPTGRPLSLPWCPLLPLGTCLEWDGGDGLVARSSSRTRVIWWERSILLRSTTMDEL